MIVSDTSISREKFHSRNRTRNAYLRAIWECLLLPLIFLLFYYLVCEAIGTAATPGLLCQPRVIVKMIVEK
jgi:hypothetical protein